jgi:hypothetical protein
MEPGDPEDTIDIGASENKHFAFHDFPPVGSLPYSGPKYESHRRDAEDAEK